MARVQCEIDQVPSCFDVRFKRGEGYIKVKAPCVMDNGGNRVPDLFKLFSTVGTV